MEEKPICPGLKNGIMSFEELIEMKMKQNSELESLNRASPSALSKKQFLKKGDGLSRWTSKGPASPGTETFDTPQKKGTIVRHRVFSASKESAPKSFNPSSRVPSHVVPPRSPKAISQTSRLPVKHTGANPLSKRKQSPVLRSPRSARCETDSKPNAKLSPMPKPVSPVPPVKYAVANPLAQSNVEVSFNKPTDTTLCSEKEFEQMEEFFGDHPNDISICSQASVVRKFMSRPSLTLKSVTSGGRSSSSSDHSTVGAEEADPNLSQKSQDFHDAETWEFEKGCTTSVSPVADAFTSQKPESEESSTQSSNSLGNIPKVPTDTEEGAPAFSDHDPLQPLNDALRAKILQLDVEIDKFRSENRKLQEKKRDFEKTQSDFIFDKKKSEEHIETETLKFEQFRRQELSKIKRERAALDQLRNQVHTLASEKNSVELVQLRERLRRTESESSEREDRLNQSLSRLKEQNRRLQLENEELKRTVEIFEKMRIDNNSTETKSKTKITQHSSGSKLSALQGLRKPLPLKSDARQNCLPVVHGDAAGSDGQVNKSTNPTGGDAALETTRKSDDGVRDTTDIDKMQPVVKASKVPKPATSQDLEIDETLQRPSSDQEQDCTSPSEKPENTVDPAQATLMSQWLKDVGLSFVEDDDCCHATLEKEFPCGKIEVARSDGSKRIVFANGTVKVTGSGGLPIFILFFNHDMKKVTEDGAVYYYYADTQTIQTTFPDGLEVMEFSTGQVEKKYPNGTQDVSFPDGTVKQTYPDGVEVCTFADGCIITTSVNGDRVIEFPNGQKEIHTSEYRSRVYPNGIVRVVYKNGLCETRYPNGEVRRKVIRETTASDTARGASTAVSTGANSASSQELPTTLCNQ